MRKDIEDALIKFQIKTFGNKNNIENFECILKDDEKVLYISPTNMEITNVNTRKKEKLPGICALTSRRFIFQYKILSNTNIESIFLDKIDSINCFGNGLIVNHIQVHTITKTFDILCSYKSSIINDIKETFENAINNYNENNNGTCKNVSKELSNIEEIKKYKELLDMDVITKEQFDTKKKELLNL